MRKLFEKARRKRTSNEVEGCDFRSPDLEANAGIVTTGHPTDSANCLPTGLELPAEVSEATWSRNGFSPNLPEISRAMEQEDCNWPFEDWNLHANPLGDPFSQLDWAIDMGYLQNGGAGEGSNQDQNLS
jgi:hypothetical protein